MNGETIVNQSDFFECFGMVHDPAESDEDSETELTSETSSAHREPVKDLRWAFERMQESNDSPEGEERRRQMSLLIQSENQTELFSFERTRPDSIQESLKRIQPARLLWVGDPKPGDDHILILKDRQPGDFTEEDDYQGTPCSI